MKTQLILTVFASLGASLMPPCAAGQARFATLYRFTDSAPVGLTAGNGVLYGAAQGGATGCGNVFELQPPVPGSGGPWSEIVPHDFTYSINDSCIPIYAPLRAANGALYGGGAGGGATLSGSLYELRPPISPGGVWTDSVIFSSNIESNLVAGPDGSLYVVGSGTQLVQLQPPAIPGGTWTSSVLYGFTEAADGLAAGPGGVLYGTTPWAAGVFGRVFQLTPPNTPGGNWTETVLHDFGYGKGRAGNPNFLTVAGDGTIYGTTYGADGAAGMGTGVVFELTSPASPGGSWTYTMLKDFVAYHPNSPLLLRDGKLYGTISKSPNNAEGGAVFELQPPSSPGGAWTTIYLHHFTNGQTPLGSLVMDNNGTLYGATMMGFSFSGTVFAIATK